MLNFSVGPVQSPENVLRVGSESTPYFRTQSFSKLMLDNERMILDLLDSPDDSSACFMTGSGTASMESVVMNLCTVDDRALVVDGGTFGHRFVELLELHQVPHDVIEIERGKPLDSSNLEPFEGRNYTAFFVNLHETSTGILYNKKLIGDFCKRNDIFLIVDVISTFLADEFSMRDMSADVAIIGSQKAIACQPGVSIIALSPTAVDRVHAKPMECMYLDIGLALQNGERGQTPFTPAVTVLLQIHERLQKICEHGVGNEIARCFKLAQRFRESIIDLPLDPNLCSPSNAVTYVRTRGFSAKAIIKALEDDYGIWVCPNGGADADSSFRVGHIGNITPEENETLIAALHDLDKRGYMRASNI